MNKLFKISLTLFITTIFVLGFTLPLNLPNGNWYQQFMPDLNGRTISDITFIDSLTGWAVTPYRYQNDTSYVLRTTNRGDNWYIQHIRIGQFVGSNIVTFLNTNTGYTAGVSNLPSYSSVLKTVNCGNNWFNVNIPTNPFTVRDMYILNEDTIWIVNSDGLTGGVYRTTNGGANWDRQLNLGSGNPDKIYMLNARIGFISGTGSVNNLYKTTNSGINWNITNDSGFTDMFFTDSLIGWKALNNMKKTTDGGLNWVSQQLPYGGLISNFGTMKQFSNINRDTIIGVGGYLFYGGGRNRAIIYKTTNGGANWLFLIPDTSYGIPQLLYIDFTDKNKGWAYSSYFSQQAGGIISSGVHTTNGGDTTWYVGLQQISNEVPGEFKLYQNYPNPFNPKTNIKYSVKRETSNVKLIVFDIQGREITTLVDQRQSPGIYQTDFAGSLYSSGIYFYSLSINNKLIDTKKMILIK